MDGTVGIEALDLFYPVQVGILPVIHHQFQESKWLKQCYFAFCRFSPDAIYHVTLHSELFRKNGGNDGGLTIFCEPENNAFGFMQHKVTCYVTSIYYSDLPDHVLTSILFHSENQKNSGGYSVTAMILYVP